MHEETMLVAVFEDKPVKLPLSRVAFFSRVYEAYISATDLDGKVFLIRSGSMSSFEKLFLEFARTSAGFLVRKSLITGIKITKLRRSVILKGFGPMYVAYKRYPTIRKIALANLQRERIGSSYEKPSATRFSSEDIALAMELRESGIDWEHIETGLGAGIRQAVGDAKRDGMRKTRETDRRYQPKSAAHSVDTLQALN